MKLQGAVTAWSFNSHVLFQLLLFCFLLIEVPAQSAGSHNVSFRPAFHVMPEAMWMNDPNGPVYYLGVYHLFFQLNPYQPVWGNMSWGHVTSSDLVYWEHQPVALVPDQSYDSYGVFSGSITLVKGVPVASYTCVDSSEKQRQCLAFPTNSSDKFLRSWTKSKFNPVIAQPPKGAGYQSFRDPTEAWRDSQENWVFAVGTSFYSNPSVVIYSTSNYSNFTTLTNFTQLSASFYKTPASNSTGTIFECPDFYPVPAALSSKTLTASPPAPTVLNCTSNKEQSLYVLKFSTIPSRQDLYILGQYNSSNNTFQPVSPFNEAALYDAGNFYASKRFWDPQHQRQVLFGWANEEDSAAEAAARGWQGVQTLPRVVEYDVETNRLLFSPLPELQALRRGTGENLNMSFPSNTTNDSVFNLTGNQLEIIANFQLSDCLPSVVEEGGNFGVDMLRTRDGTKRTRIQAYLSSNTSVLSETHVRGPTYRLLNFPVKSKVFNVSQERLYINACRNFCYKERSYCKAWTVSRIRDSESSWKRSLCQLKSSVSGFVHSASSTSGVIVDSEMVGWVLVNRSASSTSGSSSAVGASFPLKLNDTSVELHIFLDHSMLEVYVQGGRLAITTRLYVNDSEANHASIWTDGNQGVVSGVQATIWSLGSIWTNSSKHPRVLH